MHRGATKLIMSDFRLNSGYNFAYLASLPTEVVIVSSIIIQCRRPVATDEPGGVVAIGEGSCEGNRQEAPCRKKVRWSMGLTSLGQSINRRSAWEGSDARTTHIRVSGSSVHFP